MHIKYSICLKECHSQRVLKIILQNLYLMARLVPVESNKTLADKGQRLYYITDQANLNKLLHITGTGSICKMFRKLTIGKNKHVLSIYQFDVLPIRLEKHIHL